MAVFMSYCPYFSGSRAICMARKTRYMFERYAKNSSFSCFMVVFMSYCPLFRFVGRFAWLVRPDTCLRVMTKTPFSRFIAIFMSYCPRFWGFQGDLHGLRDPIHVSELGPKTRSFHVLCPFS